LEPAADVGPTVEAAGAAFISVVTSDTVKRVTLELGGKYANLLLSDADSGKAMEIGPADTCINGGQTCTAWIPMLAPAARHDEIAGRGRLR
jgi:aldehyde dehydrogenase (NAD+)